MKKTAKKIKKVDKNQKYREFNAKKLIKQFPILSKKNDGKKIVYLDSAATSQKPYSVIKKVSEVYTTYNANVHRGLYSLSYKVTEEYENVRLEVASLINCNPDEIIFTKGTTEALNLVASGISEIIEKGRKKILLTEFEHHSNLVPWQEFARKKKMILDFVKITDSFDLDYVDLRKKLDKNVALFAFTAVSNTTGTIVDCKLACSLARKNGIITLIDAAQLMPRGKVDVQDLDCDFLAFSSHKMLGPSGVGVLFAKKQLLERLEPINFGGGMIREVEYQKSSYADGPQRFEGGTPNIEGVIGLGEAIQFLNKVGLKNIEMYEMELTRLATVELGKIKKVKIYHPGVGKGSSIISFNVDGVHAHDVATILDESGICVRAGHHCTMPLMRRIGIQGSVRASFYLYNTKEDVLALVKGVRRVVELFRGK